MAQQTLAIAAILELSTVFGSRPFRTAHYGQPLFNRPLRSATVEMPLSSATRRADLQDGQIRASGLTYVRRIPLSSRPRLKGLEVDPLSVLGRPMQRVDRASLSQCVLAIE